MDMYIFMNVDDVCGLTIQWIVVWFLHEFIHNTIKLMIPRDEDRFQNALKGQCREIFDVIFFMNHLCFQ